jgi:hypothetical protein
VNGDGTVFEITGAEFVLMPPPTITGEGQTTTTIEAPVTPFGGMTIGDPNPGATDTLTITLAGGGGVLADGLGFSGLTSVADGVYMLTGTALAITSELDALVFTPNAAWANASATTLSDVGSTAHGASAVNSATSVIDNDPSGAISISAAYFAANIDGVNAASQVTSITLTDSGIPQVNVADAQATGDTTALDEIVNPIFEVLAPGMALIYCVGGNGANGTPLPSSASSSAVVERANSKVTLAGSNDTVTIAAGSNLRLAGSNDSITATTGDKITIKAGTGETITGSGFTVRAAIGTGFAVGGNGVPGTLDRVNGSGASLAVQDTSNVVLTGSNDSVSMAAGSNLSVSGFTDAFTATIDDKIRVKAGIGETINGSGFAVHGGSETGFTIVGTGDVVYAAVNDAITDSGSSTKFKINSNVDNLAICGFGEDPPPANDDPGAVHAA